MMDQRTMEPIIEANSDQTTDILVGVTSGHPLGTTIGSVLGASTACAAAVVLMGPVWAIVGVTFGAIAGGLGGRAIAEIIEPRDFDARYAAQRSVAGEPVLSAKIMKRTKHGSIVESARASKDRQVPPNR